jgi:hypothetical protein
MRRAAVRVVGVALAILLPTGRARGEGGTERYMLRAELGVEYDSNVHRTEILKGSVDPPPLQRSPLGRGVVTGSLSDIIAPGQDIALAATAAGKLFWEPAARDEDVAVAESAATWRLRLSPRAILSASGFYYEAVQRSSPDDAAASERRDFRSLTGGLRLGVALAPHLELGAGGGYRLFVFKPDRDFDFLAPSASLDLRWARESPDGAGADWEAGLGASIERRAFAGLALVSSCADPPCLPTVGGAKRVDDLLVTHVEVARVEKLLVGAGYAFHYNRSNSFGDSVLRHFVTARFAAPLPFEIYLTARAEVLFASYPQGTLVGQVAPAGSTFTSIEDENRSNARVDLSRNLSDRLQLIARYTFYGPALGGTRVTYNRQTALLSLAFTLEK